MKTPSLPLRFLLAAVVALATVCHSAGVFYGRESLYSLRPYGVAVKVVCTGGLEQHKETFQDHIQTRLKARGVTILPDASVTLKLFAKAIQSNDGFFVVHMELRLDQAAYLASNNKMVDATTWDAFRMGEFREEDLLQEVDDLARQFLNDYIATN
jgi:hypothetical protein